jgi:hypothetical protein
MVLIPTESAALIEFEDQQGQRALVRINFGFTPDILTDAGAWYANNASGLFAKVFDPAAGTDITRTVAAMSNAKVVRVGLLFTSDWSVEPTGEAGLHKYVQEKARLTFRDGSGGVEHLSIPAPIDGLFLTGVGMQTVVDPALAVAGVIKNLMTAVAGTAALTPRGGTWGSQFFGGQLATGKPPRRRRIQSP